MKGSRVRTRVNCISDSPLTSRDGRYRAETRESGKEASARFPFQPFRHSASAALSTKPQEGRLCYRKRQDHPGV